jgi:hypothetical protein
LKRKALFVFAILLLPSLIYIFFALSKANFRKLPYHGPKAVRDTVINGKSQRDTVYYTIPPYPLTISGRHGSSTELLRDSIYIALFIDEWNSEAADQLKGLAEYAVRKKEDLRYMHFIFFTPIDTSGRARGFSYGDSLKLDKGAGTTVQVRQSLYDSLKTLYFVPVNGMIFKHTKLGVLVDRRGRIRGYHDAGSVMGMRTLKEDFQHLRLRDEAEEHRQKFKIEQKPGSK